MRNKKPEETWLNLGCGLDADPDCVNVDLRPLPGVDLVLDLNVMPWPWEDGSIARVITWDLLEHLEDPLAVAEEVWRILKDGGSWWIRVPHYRSPLAWADLTHKRPYCEYSFDYLDPATDLGRRYGSYYSQARFKILKRRIEAVDLGYTYGLSIVFALAKLANPKEGEGDES